MASRRPDTGELPLVRYSGWTELPARAQVPARVEFYTVAQVAVRLRVSKMAVYRLVHGGELAAARVGRSFRVPRRAVEEHLRRSCVDAP